MAGVTRLELATSCVTGKRSNQLSYTPKQMCGKNKMKWWVMTGSNCRPSPCKGDALPTELITRRKMPITAFFGLRFISKYKVKKPTASRT